MSKDRALAPGDPREAWDPLRVWLVLAIIVTIGLFLRFWGLRHGLPYIYHPDEHLEVYRALRLGRGDFEFDRITKGGFFYLLFVEYGIYYAFLSISGKVHSAQEFARSIIDDPSKIWIIGRATVAVVGTINVFVVYRLGVRVAGPAAGLGSAFFMSVAFLPVALSHRIGVDVPMTCLVSLALLYALRILQQGSVRDYAVAGILVGLATMNKLPAVLAFVPIGLAHLLRGTEGPFVAWLKRSAFTLGICGLAFSVVYVLGTPGILWKFGEILGGVFGQFAGEGWSHDIPSEMREPVNTWVFYVAALAGALGIPLLVVSLVGIVLALIVRNRELIVLSSFVMVMYLVLALSQDTNLVYSRYVLPMIPPLTVLGASVVVRLTSVLSLSRAWRVCALAALTSMIALPTLLDSVSFGLLHTREDTRTMAKKWIEDHYPAGTRVFMKGNPEESSQLTIPLESTVENLQRMTAEHAKDNPGKSYYLKIRADLAKAPGYDIVTAQMHERWPSWQEFQDWGVGLVVLRDALPEAGAALPTAEIPRSRARLIRELVNAGSVTLVAVFDPVELRRPGPVVWIYAVGEEVEGVR